MQGTRAADELKKLVGQDQVLDGEQDLVTYASDMLPRHQILKHEAQLPSTLPVAICFPESVDDVVRVLRFCAAERIPVIPFGAGSGVCGATVPEEPAVILDMKRMGRVLELSEASRCVTVEPGILGERLEEHLQARGFTLGHSPSSVACSTVGGYVACRSAGQYSSRFGKFEDMTLGVEGVSADGTLLRFGTLGRGHHRDPLVAAVLGSEGTLLVVTKVALRMEPLPARTDFRGLAFPSVEEGLQCMRRVMQAPLRPTVMRLYDPLDSFIAGHSHRTPAGEDVHRAAGRFSGLRLLLASALTDLNRKGLAALLYQPGLVNKVAELLPTRPLLVVGVQGSRTAVSRQWDRIIDIAQRSRGEDLGPEPGWAWHKRRYAVSHKQTKVFNAGAFVDTMEVAATWDGLFPLYKSVLKEMGPHVFVTAHFSHAYEEGCSIYFTFAGYRPSVAAALKVYQRAWKAGLETAVRHGATVSHHHSIGVLKRGFLDRESPGARELFAAFKKALDPAGILNPGKLFAVDAQERGAP